MSDLHVNRRTLASGEPRWRLQGRLDGRQWSRTFGTEREALHWRQVLSTVGVRKGLDLIDEQDADPQEDAPVVTVRWVVGEYIRTRSGITTGTRARYQREAERDIHPTLGDLAVARLDRDMVAAWINELDLKGLKRKTIKNRVGLLSPALKWAIDRGHVATNAAEKPSLPSSIQAEMTCLEREEIAELLDVVNEVDAKYRDLITILVGTGIRWGEATALEARDIIRHGNGDFTVRVTKAWKEIYAGAPTLGAPKTRKAVRDILVPGASPVAAALRRQLELRSNARDLLFQTPRGKLLRNSEFHRRVWQPIRRKLRERGWHKEPRIHDLRHTAASLMLHNGMTIHAVAAVLGHNKVSTTVDIYGHLLDGAKDAASAALAGVIPA